MKKRKPCAVFMAAIAAFVVAAACSQPAGSSPVPVISITAHPTARMEVLQGSISGSLSVTAEVTENAVLEYYWYSNTSESNVGGTLLPVSPEASFFIPISLTEGTYYYFCEITAPGAVSVRSTVATVTVLSAGTPYISITTQPVASTEVTEGSITGSLSVAASGINGATVTGYQWYSNTTASNEGGTTVAGATAASFIIPTNLIVGEHYYYCEITASGGASSKRSDVTTVRVLSAGTPAITITTQPKANTEVTEGSITGSLTVDAVGIGGASITGYQWYINTTASNEGGSLVPDETSRSFFLPDNLLPGEYYYFCEIRAPGAVSKRSEVATVTVLAAEMPAIVITYQPQDMEVTEGSITEWFNIQADVINGGGIDGYQWYSNTSASTVGGTQLSDGFTKYYPLPPGLTEGVYYYFCEVIGSQGAASVRSDVATVTVSADPVPVITITTQPATNTPVKVGAITGSLSVTAEATESAVLSYQWYRNTTASTVGGTEIPGETSNSFTIPTNLTAGEYYYYCQITASDGAVLKHSNVATVTASNPSTNFVIKLYGEPELVEQKAEVPSGTQFSAAGSGWATFQWYVDGIAQAGATSAAYTLNKEPGVYDLTVVVTDAEGDTYSGSCRVTVK